LLFINILRDVIAQITGRRKRRKKREDGGEEYEEEVGRVLSALNMDFW